MPQLERIRNKKTMGKVADLDRTVTRLIARVEELESTLLQTIQNNHREVLQLLTKSTSTSTSTSSHNVSNNEDGTEEVPVASQNTLARGKKDSVDSGIVTLRTDEASNSSTKRKKKDRHQHILRRRINHQIDLQSKIWQNRTD